MGISLGALSLDPIAPADIARGDVNRSVNAELVSVEIGTWRRAYDGVAAPFLLSGIYGATLAALLEGKSFDFFCLDDPDGGRVQPAVAGRVLIQLKGGERHDLSGFEVLSASFCAIAQIAEFLTKSGHPKGAAILLSEVAGRAPPSGLGHTTETV